MKLSIIPDDRRCCCPASKKLHIGCWCIDSLKRYLLSGLSIGYFSEIVARASRYRPNGFMTISAYCS